MNVASVIERWTALQSRLRIGIGAAAFAVLLIVAVVLLLGRDTRVALFANALKPDQLAEVDAQLSQWSIAFVPTHDNVRVDAQRSYEANASIFDVGKRIAERAIDLDRP